MPLSAVAVKQMSVSATGRKVIPILCKSNKLKSRVDFNRSFDSFHVPLYWNLDENAFAES